MALTSVEAVIAAIAAGQTFRIPYQRTINTGATTVSGRWHECMGGTGTGGPMTLTGSAGVGVALDYSTAGALPLTPSSVSPSERRLLTMSAMSNVATAIPGMVLLTDLLYMYPSCVVTGTPTTLNNGAAKPTRFNSGVGVQATAIAATAHSIAAPGLTMTYTNSGGTGTRTGSFKAQAALYPVGALYTGGTASSLGSPMMNLGAGDSGVQQLDSYTIATGTTGTVTFMLHRPLAWIPTIAANVVGERDFLFQFPTFPKIDDDACLGLFYVPGGALPVSQLVFGAIETVWG